MIRDQPTARRERRRIVEETPRVDVRLLRRQGLLSVRQPSIRVEGVDVGLMWVPWGFTEGGERPWFECPLCQHRVLLLYQAPPLGCRECLDLAYAAQNLSPARRAELRSLRARRKLGCAETWGGPIRKPLRRHWGSFLRDAEKIAEVEGTSLKEALVLDAQGSPVRLIL
jgi:hypothetical protein